MIVSNKEKAATLMVDTIARFHRQFSLTPTLRERLIMSDELNIWTWRTSGIILLI